MKCKLCLQDKELSDSHVIPQFLFKSVFDEYKKITQVDFIDEKNTKTVSGVGYEKLLCPDCESNFSKLESYAAEAIFKTNPARKSKIIEQEIAEHQNLKTVRVKGLDYNRSKLFFLSLLWRAAITDQPLFKEVDLGPYQEKLRKILLSGLACPENKYEIVLIKIIGNESRPFMSVLPVRRASKNGNTHYIFYINSYIIYCNLSNNNKDDIFETGYLKESGEIDVYHLSGDYAVGFFEGLAGRGIQYKGPFKTN